MYIGLDFIYISLQCLWPFSLGVVFLATVLEVAGKTPCHAVVPQDPGEISGCHIGQVKPDKLKGQGQQAHKHSRWTGSSERKWSRNSNGPLVAAPVSRMSILQKWSRKPQQRTCNGRFTRDLQHFSSLPRAAMLDPVHSAHLYLDETLRGSSPASDTSSSDCSKQRP